MEFEYEKPLVPKQVHLKLPFSMKKYHKWYDLACVYGLNFIEAKIPRHIFKTLYFDLHVDMPKLHTIYHLKIPNFTMMTIWCM
jgi:hypothetical protein